MTYWTVLQPTITARFFVILAQFNLQQFEDALFTQAHMHPG